MKIRIRFHFFHLALVYACSGSGSGVSTAVGISMRRMHVNTGVNLLTDLGVDIRRLDFCWAPLHNNTQLHMRCNDKSNA